MYRIHKVLDWPVAEQTDAYTDGTYGTKLQAKMEAWKPEEVREDAGHR